MSEYDGDLLAHPFVIDLSPEMQKRVAECVVGPVRWEANSIVFREGGRANSCYLIMSGLVAVEAHSPGREPRILQTLSEGDVLGWSWLFPPYRWTFDAHAHGETEALELDGAKLRELVEDDHALGYEVLYQFSRLVVRRLNATRLQLLDLYGDHT